MSLSREENVPRYDCAEQILRLISEWSLQGVPWTHVSVPDVRSRPNLKLKTQTQAQQYNFIFYVAILSLTRGGRGWVFLGFSLTCIIQIRQMVCAYLSAFTSAWAHRLAWPSLFAADKGVDILGCRKREARVKGCCKSGQQQVCDGNRRAEPNKQDPNWF